MEKANKTMGRFWIKYLPSILALTCAFKIFFNVMSDVEKDCWLLYNNWTNIALNIITLCCVYHLGRYFGYCWKHRSLCRIAGCGYVFYTYFIATHAPKEHILHITCLYVAIVVIMTLLYKEVK